jgi:ABC-type glycerol-3-phosphate transport system permease component
LLLHAFLAITLIIAVFFVLRALHLLNTLAGVMLVKVALELPFALWVMKGFLMASPGQWRWLPWWTALIVSPPGIVSSYYRYVLG